MSRSYRILIGVIVAIGAGFALPKVFAPSVHISSDQNGLASLQYRGHNYLASGRFNLNRVDMISPTGEQVQGSLSQTAKAFPKENKIIQTYSWGELTAIYAAAGSRLDLNVQIVNKSPNTIHGIFADALSLRFPEKPKQYDNVTPILTSNTGDISTLRVNYGKSSSLLLCNDDVSKPLLIGFPFALDRPTSTIFPLRIFTSRDKTMPDSLPFVDRPIGPGASDTYRVSLRFASASDTTRSIASDVYESYSKAHPFTLDWPDRRPIGSLILATSKAGFPTNPRGWLLDKSFDVTTRKGRAEFQAKMLEWADRSLKVLLDMHAQGMITWDIEGEEFAHPTTYIGDPRMIEKLAPEMAEIADAYFKKFRDAGLRVGVCVRPQQLLLESSGKANSYRQTEATDISKVLIEKISYARNRWGATLFYIDSNGDPNRPYPVEIFEKVSRAVPNVLLIPEHHDLSYYASTAPYMELRQDHDSTPARVREMIPEGFSVINIVDGPIDARRKQLQEAFKRGDIALFRGWYDDPLNLKLKALIPTATE